MDGLDDAILTAIGEITFAYSELESTLALYTWVLIDPMRLRTGIVVTAGMDFRKIMPAPTALVIDKNDPDDTSVEAQEIRDRLKTLLVKVEKAREERNRIAHSRWLTSAAATVVDDDPNSIILRVKQSKDQRKGWNMQFEAWKLDRFLSILTQIRSADNELHSFATFARSINRVFPAAAIIDTLNHR